MSDKENILLNMVNAAVKAGFAILKVKNAQYTVKTKSDNSPVTDADYTAQNIITEMLSALNIPFISEESVAEDFPTRSTWKEMFVVDPLDGTKEFINGSSQYGVNIAFVEKDTPTMGVIFLPEVKELYYGGNGYPVRKASVKNDEFFTSLAQLKGETLPLGVHSGGYICLASKSARTSETNDYYEALKKEIPDVRIEPMGSCVKYCAIATGAADEYTRFGSVMEWDTAAGDALLRSMDMPLRDIHSGEPLKYNKQILHSSDFTVKRKR
ncbi:MAG: hypothetical protein PHD21_00045 [Flavobacteriales bacterium]|nr:hypothetical protein [Flavobacteriales bacterium]